MDVVAEREVICQRKDGAPTRVILRIGRPYAVGDMDWACPVAAEGLFPELADIHGVDSFQSLMLAQRFLGSLLMRLHEGGGSIRSVEDDSALDIEDLFRGGT